MQDNELDKLINDAANQHHPPYDDEAWGKMLVLLDKHLPQKKDRRRPAAFWLLFLLLGGAVTLGVLQPWNKNKNGNSSAVAKIESSSSAQNTTAPQIKENGAATPNSASTTNSTHTVALPATENNTSKGSSAIPQTNTGTSKPAANNSFVNGEAFVRTNKNISARNSRPVIKVQRPVTAADDEATITATAAGKEKKTSSKTKTTVKPAAAEEDDNKNVTAAVTAAPQATLQTADEKTTAVTAKQNSQQLQKDSAARQPATVTAVTSSKPKKDRGFAGNFALTFSTGADLSFIDLKNPGKVKLFYGAGAAYTIGKHLKVSSGFYVSKKVYYAEPYQYKFPNGVAYPHLTGIDASCNVYEIPVSLSYNFAQHKNHNWFAGAGLSSFLMKKEYYNYQYQTPTGQTYSYARTITDENKHYFSVVTLSGGYQYTLNKHIALVAEPYLKLPLAGVGAGKIKLNSSGILLTAAIKPFARNKK